MRRLLVALVLVAVTLALALPSVAFAGEGTWTATQRTSTDVWSRYCRQQVVGDTIYYTWIDDPAGNAWEIWTATMDIDGSNWVAAKRTEGSGSVLSLDMQVVSGVIHYAWTLILLLEGPDYRHAVWTAMMSIDGSEWAEAEHDRSSRQKRDVRLQVVDSTIYYVYIQLDGSNVRQVRTATMDTDGTGWASTERTSSLGHKDAPAHEVVENTIYYIYTHPDEASYEQVWTATMDIGGSGWSSIQRTSDETYKYDPQLQVVGDTIYYVLQLGDENVPSGWDEYIYTATMGTDGSNWSRVQRTSGDMWAEEPQLHVVGGEIYYVFVAWNSDAYEECALFAAETDIDGSGWAQFQRTSYSSSSMGSSHVQVSDYDEYYVWYDREAGGSWDDIWTARLDVTPPVPAVPHWMLRVFPSVIALVGVVGMFMILQTINFAAIVAALEVAVVSIVLCQVAVYLAGF